MKDALRAVLDDLRFPWKLRRVDVLMFGVLIPLVMLLVYTLRY